MKSKGYTLNPAQLKGEDLSDDPQTTLPLPWPGPASVGENFNLTPLDSWRAAPVDALDILVLNEPGRYLWIGGVLYGDGKASLVLHQMRLTYDHDTWLGHLPAVYRRNENNRAFLERSLTLFQSLLESEATLIEELPRLFDPWAAPNDNAPESWLDWLSSWLAFELKEVWREEEEAWREEKRWREALAGAFALYSRRGTKEGLKEFVRIYTGLDATIDEPNLLPLQIGVHSTIGKDMYLGGGPPYFFRVTIFLPWAAPEVQARQKEVVRALIELEKPAHTSYELEVVSLST